MVEAPDPKGLTLERVRQPFLFTVGAAALIYAVIPPLEPEYVALAGGLLGLIPLDRARSELR
jgi:hypothetical protein